MKVKFPVSVHPEYDEGMVAYIWGANDQVLFDKDEVEQVVARANAFEELMGIVSDFQDHLHDEGSTSQHLRDVMEKYLPLLESDHGEEARGEIIEGLDSCPEAGEFEKDPGDEVPPVGGFDV